MDARTTITSSQAFVVAPNDVKKLFRILTDRIGDTTIHSLTADGIEREHRDAKSLCDGEYPWQKRIVSLRFSSASDDRKKRINLRIAESGIYLIDVEVVASDDVVERLREELLVLFGGLRPWYYRIAQFDFIGSGFLVLLGLVVLVSVLVAVGLVEMNESPSAIQNRQQANGIALLFAIVLCGAIFNRARAWLFPMGTFAIGQTAARAEFLEKIRWGVVVGFVVSLAASLAVLLIPTA